jgi:hypothetical protein
MYLNANIPPIECFVRGNYLRDQKDSHDKEVSLYDDRWWYMVESTYICIL